MIENIDSAAQTAQKWLERFPVESRVALKFSDIELELRSNSVKLGKKIEEYYNGFVVPEAEPKSIVYAWESDSPTIAQKLIEQPREAGKSGIKEAYADLPDGVWIHKVRTGMQFLLGPGVHHAIGPCCKNEAQIVNFLNNRMIELYLRQGFRLGHASAIRIGNHGIAIAGYSGMGKSTLALHLMAETNAVFISNDRILFRKDPYGVDLRGVAKHPRINPGTILSNAKLRGIATEGEMQRWQHLAKEELWSLEEKHDGRIDDCFGKNRFELESRLHCFFILNWQLDGGAMNLQEVDLRQRRDLLSAIRKSPGLFYRPENPQQAYDNADELYRSHLDGVRIFELSGGVHFSGAVQAIKELAEG